MVSADEPLPAGEGSSARGRPPPAIPTTKPNPVIPEKPKGFIRDPAQPSQTGWVPVFRSAKTGMTMIVWCSRSRKRRAYVVRSSNSLPLLPGLLAGWPSGARESGLPLNPEKSQKRIS